MDHKSPKVPLRRINLMIKYFSSCVISSTVPSSLHPHPNNPQNERGQREWAGDDPVDPEPSWYNCGQFSCLGVPVKEWHGEKRGDECAGKEEDRDGC